MKTKRKENQLVVSVFDPVPRNLVDKFILS